MDNNNKQPSAITMIQELKGTPLTILMAMFVRRLPVTQTVLAETLGYDAKTVKSGLDFLIERGYVERVHYRQWRLSGKVFPASHRMLEARAGHGGGLGAGTD